MGEVIEVDWVLHAESGRLGYRGLRVVERQPHQGISLPVGPKAIAPGYFDQAERILRDQVNRGIFRRSVKLEDLRDAVQRDDAAPDGASSDDARGADEPGPDAPGAA